MLVEEGCSADALQAQPECSPGGEGPQAQAGAGSTIRDRGERLPILQPPSLATQTKPHGWIRPICEPSSITPPASCPGNECAGQDALTPEQGARLQTVEVGTTWKQKLLC